MKTLSELLNQMNPECRYVLSLRCLSKEEFVKRFHSSKLYEKLHNSKVGLIEIENENKHISGFTPNFGEGINCLISDTKEWFETSIIQNIFWENSTFQTVANVYSFKFQEIKYDDLIKDIQKILNESKSKET